MLLNHQHAASLQARYERHAKPATPSREFLTLAALAGLLKHFTGSDDGISDELVQAASDCVGDDDRADGGCSVRDLLKAWDYSDTPQAAVSYLATLLAPSQPVNRGLLDKTASDVMVSL